ncbi:uncharacterized protein IL334_006424 [Kwoniella shivajii]|uniref:Uncharacterized protein n=1 Tax=Kwoniella shivajii TaxID=564305 RepID=A0ABZ1D696_9TREE|nr:hypothetical protein IL334_006424 [Kwoniella shivajii]
MLDLATENCLRIVNQDILINYYSLSRPRSKSYRETSTTIKEQISEAVTTTRQTYSCSTIQSDENTQSERFMDPDIVYSYLKQIENTVQERDKVFDDSNTVENLLADTRERFAKETLSVSKYDSGASFPKIPGLSNDDRESTWPEQNQ